MPLIVNLKRFVKNLFASRGYRLNKVPQSLLKNPSAELRPGTEYIIAHYMLKKRELFFVQIGAFDGVTGDPIRRFALDYGWKGVFVEPQEKYYKLLKKNYSDSPNFLFKNAAISTKKGKQTLYKLNESAEALVPWCPQLASFKLETILTHRYAIPQIERYIEKEEVECLTLDDLLDEIGPIEVDLLVIDAEGFDYEIIMMINFLRMKPQIIRFEQKHLGRGKLDKCVAILMGQGYSVCVEDNDITGYRA